MNIAELSIKNRVTTFTIAILTLFAGFFAYENLGRLEDPEFTIKDVLIYTQMPGASAEEMRKLVTQPIENAAQQLGQCKRVTSRSERNISIVTVTMKDQYDKNTLPQVFDELRRKITQVQLPQEASKPIVNDDYGDVYGIFLAFTGEDENYTKEDMRKFADYLQQELVQVDNVKKVTIVGAQPERIYVKISREKVNRMLMSLSNIFQKLKQQNMFVNCGTIVADGVRLPIQLTGRIDSVKAIENLMIGNNKEGQVVRFKDIATVERGYVDPARPMLRFNQKPAIGIGISVSSGGNVVQLGRDVKKRLAQLKEAFPVGVKMNIISMQSDSVTKAINSFINNLCQAVGIVILVLLIFMGLRSGLIIGVVLILTIAGTMIVMYVMDITLQRISLGALIIALGMLVDNAIVITDGILVQIQKGCDRIKAANEVVAQNKMPLLGATVIAILAFAAIGTSNDSTGEFCGSLFYVLLISLMISWIAAITITPLLCIVFIKVKTPKNKSNKTPQQLAVQSDPHDGPIYRGYRWILRFCLRLRFIPVVILLALLFSSAAGFSKVKQSFFPSSTRPQFLVDLWLPYGTDIETTKKIAVEAEKTIKKLKKITDVSTFVGSGAPRFILTYAPEQPDSSYMQMLMSVDDYREIEKLAPIVQNTLSQKFPQAMVNVKKFLLGPSSGGKIQLRLSGPNIKVLRAMSNKAMQIMHDSPNTKAIYSNWRDMRPVIKPALIPDVAERLGVTQADVLKSIRMSTSGTIIGSYREGKVEIPIVAKPPIDEIDSVDDLRDILICSPISGKIIPLQQVVKSMHVEYENGMVHERQRTPTITIHCDPTQGLASTLLAQLRPKLEKMFKDENLPVDYKLEWGGEYEDSKNAQESINASIPVFGIMMILILIMLFNAIRQPIIIMLIVPLAIIGVTAGLLVTNQPFGFMAMLGMLSLSGMLIKNAIVLIDQIDLEIRSGKDKFLAILDSAISRARPVMMATATTVLGMLPLIKDAFYISMAVTIMFGLMFAAILTLLAVPVLYSLLFRIRENKAPKVTTANSAPSLRLKNDRQEEKPNSENEISDKADDDNDKKSSSTDNSEEDDKS